MDIHLFIPTLGQYEEPYGDNMPGMTLDEFQAWSDRLIREVKESE